MPITKLPGFTLEPWIPATINATSTKANSGFDIGGLAYNTANSGVGIGTSAFGQANLAYDTANSGFGIGTSAFGQANLAYAKANSGFDIGGLAYAKANSAYDVASLAYNTANSAGGGSSGPIILTGTSNITDCLTPAATRKLTSTSNNIILGMNAGQCVANTQGRNIMLGLYSGLSQCCGNNNVFLGTSSGQRAYSGSNDNIFIGQNSGIMACSGNNAIAIGKQAQGYCGSLAPYTVCHSVAIGAYSGWKCGSTGSTSTGGVWIGHGAYSPNCNATTATPISIGDCAASGAYSISIGKCSGVHPSANGNAVQSCQTVSIGHCAGYRATVCNSGCTLWSVYVGSCAGACICCSCCVKYVVAIGASAGCATPAGCYSVQVGASSQSFGSSGVAIGYSSRVCASNGIAIGNGTKSICAGSISIGAAAGAYGYGGTCSIAIGRNAAYQCAGTYSIAIGLYAGCASSGYGNIILGNRTKSSGCAGCYSVAIGNCAARCIKGFCCSIYIGAFTAQGNYGCYSNFDTIIGARSAFCINYGGCNTIVGAKNGDYSLCGCHNTFIGYCVGKNVTGMADCICVSCTMALGSYLTCRLIIPGLGLDTACATANQVLCWTGTCFAWGSGGGGGASCLICLTDVCVQLCTLTDGDFLCWRANANTWVNSSYVAGGGGGGGPAWTQTVGGYYNSGGSYSQYANFNCIFACNLTNNPFSIITLFAQLCLPYWSQSCAPACNFCDSYIPGAELQNCGGSSYCTCSRTYNNCGSYGMPYRHWPACWNGSLTCLGSDVTACGSNVYSACYNGSNPTVVASWNSRPFSPYMIYGISIDPNWNCCTSAPYLRYGFYCGCMSSGGPLVAGYYKNPASTSKGHYGVVSVQACIASCYGSPLLACLQARVCPGVCILYACSNVGSYHSTSHFVYKVSDACFQCIAAASGYIFCNSAWCSGDCWRSWTASVAC